jgi:hypothetical protein
MARREIVVCDWADCAETAPKSAAVAAGSGWRFVRVYLIDGSEPPEGAANVDLCPTHTSLLMAPEPTS